MNPDCDPTDASLATPPLGRESSRLDALLEKTVSAESRRHLWELSKDVLDAADALDDSATRTGLVLGYVQSGKTTAMTSLMAAAADRGCRLVVAILGSTNLLLDQNHRRIAASLGIGERNDYSWVAMQNPRGISAARELATWLDRGRVVIVPLLKHRGRIQDLADVLRSVDGISAYKTLIVDDEADQGSLNTAVRSGVESPVYAAIDRLRAELPDHTFIQFTATPYAPLLLAPTDPLFPRFVRFLRPGSGYTGGREFFVDHAAAVLRTIPFGDEQVARATPADLPQSLVSALWGFLAGAAVLVARDPTTPPISMLVHASHKTDIQARYRFLLERELRAIKSLLDGEGGQPSIPLPARVELDRLSSMGIAQISEGLFADRLRYVVSQAHLWLLNSATAVRKVDWRASPVHILVGGNKLDRGFTVEGLTVTYMNRPPSDQIDTIEQRARAFGYRSEFLPFCQFFASARTLKLLREIVFTEHDLRASIHSYVEEGRSVADWASEIGLLVPGGAKPTRDAVLQSIGMAQMGWHQLRRPSLADGAIGDNLANCERIGLFSAPLRDFGRLSFRALSMPATDALALLLLPWKIDSYSGGWNHDWITQAFQRASASQSYVDVILMEQNAGRPDAAPRLRSWDAQEGFENLFQGRDVQSQIAGSYYPGDRSIPGIESEPERLAIQVHRVTPRQIPNHPGLLTLAVHLGDRQVARRTNP